MNKKKKFIRKMSLLLTCGGILFIAFAILLLLSKGSFVKFPRTDIAPVGFSVVGVIYLICAIGMLLVTQDKQAMIEENDERSKIIEAKSGIIAFIVQTLLLSTGIFLLVFTGYLNAVSTLCFIAVLVISVIVFATAQIYFGKKF